MRKHLVLILAAATAIAVGAAGVAWATDSATSTVKASVQPTKLPKKKMKPIKLNVEVFTLSNSNPGTPTNPGTVPPATTDVKIFFDDDGNIDTKGLKTCDPNKISQATTQQALKICGKAKVGSGSATACVGSAGVPCVPVSFVVTAFNGPSKGKKPTIILHSRSDALNLTTTLIGTIKRLHSGPFGNVLDVPVPKLPATITDFKTSVKKTWKFKGKKHSYVSARCGKGHKFSIKAVFTYSGSEDTDSSTDAQKCKVKK